MNLGTLAIKIQMPFQIMCVQCGKEMKPAKGTKGGIPTCPQCGFKVKIILTKAMIPGLPGGVKLQHIPKFKRPAPMA